MPVRIGVTGAHGLIGWHVRAFLRVYRPTVEVRLATRETFASPKALDNFVAGLDAVVHCAGMNRGEESEVETCNAELARSLADACSRSAAAGNKYPHVVYTNSTHIERNTSYGRGKRFAAEVLGKSAAAHGALFSDMVLPHVFGEFGKPFYNSVVATFCYQLSIGEQPQVQVDGDLELAHVQTVAAEAIAAIEEGVGGKRRLSGQPIKVSGLLEILRAMEDAYFQRQVVPDLRDPFHLSLFNTLRSFRYSHDNGTFLTLHQDNRGTLFEAIKTDNGGQTFLSTSHPGVTRGNHFHTRKFERFLVCSGQAEIRIRKLFSDQVRVFHVSGDKPCYVDMPTFHTHNIVNTGSSELVTLFWANEIFDRDNPDTYLEVVQ